MGKVLVVEDNLEMQKIIKECLKKYEIHAALDIKSAQSKLEKEKFDLILLDIGLPDGDGLRFLTYIKNLENGSLTPTIFLTSRNQTEDVVMGFQLGAEDYITKPFNPFEFRARIEARMHGVLLRRTEEKILRSGNLVLDLAKQQARRLDDFSEQNLDLTPLEFKILCFFVKNEDFVFERNQLIDEIWGNSVNVSDRAVDTHISNIRKKIKNTSHSIFSIYGAGYALRKVTSKAA
jgi:DNA-binding response OmpR family regulator